MRQNPDCEISIVVITYNEGAYLGRTVQSFLASLPPKSEIIIVDDSSTDGSAANLQRDGVVRVFHPPQRLGPVKARNFGARLARGHIIVFSDAHIEVKKDWFLALLAPLKHYQVGAVGPVITDLEGDGRGYGLRFRDAALNCEWGGCRGNRPHPVPILGAGFFAMRQEIFQAFGGFDTGMITFGMEDPDLDIRLWTFGFECLLVPRVEVAHLFRSKHSFHNWENFLYNMMRYGTVHFGRRRMCRLMGAYANDECLPAVLERLASSDSFARRRRVQSNRIYDDDWYFSKFGMDY